jgi:hypothetical protein
MSIRDVERARMANVLIDCDNLLRAKKGGSVSKVQAKKGGSVSKVQAEKGNSISSRAQTLLRRSFFDAGSMFGRSLDITRGLLNMAWASTWSPGE